MCNEVQGMSSEVQSVVLWTSHCRLSDYKTSGQVTCFFNNVRYNVHKKEARMNAMTATKARANLFKLMAFVNDNSQPLTLTNSKGKNAVLIGEDDWNAIQETMYLNSVPGMAESLEKGKNTPLEDCLSEDELIFSID